MQKKLSVVIINIIQADYKICKGILRFWLGDKQKIIFNLDNTK